MNKIQKILTGFIFTFVLLHNNADAMKRLREDVDPQKILILLDVIERDEHKDNEFIFFIEHMAKRPKKEFSKKDNSKRLVKHEFERKPIIRPDKYKCNECDFAASSMEDVHSHAQKHAVENGPAWKFEDGKYRCNDCRYCVSDIRFIKNHQITHIMQNFSNVKMHTCETCGYLHEGFNHHQLHLNTHLTQKKYGCEGTKKNGKKCEFKTRHSRSLDRHIRLLNNSSRGGVHYRTDLIKNEK